MVENRLREWFAEQVERAQGAGSMAAFVPCPCCLVTGMNTGQLAFVKEIYRRAREMVEAQFQKPARSRTPEFSVN
jgi:hypothetical protein